METYVKHVMNTYIYINNNIIYIYTKETVFERISHNKQVLDGLGDAAAHASTNWMTLYFSQDLQSADQFSEAKQTQPVHLQHHPACPSMSLQHVIVLFDTLSLISMLFAATLFFVLRRKSTTVQSS